MQILVLGGTGEASALARDLAARPDLDAILSFAGRTKIPDGWPIRTRVGGFGGIEGLVAYLRAEKIDAMVDAELVDGGTLLTVTESGVEAIPGGRRAEAFRMNERGWGIQMSNIQDFVAGHA
jgi:precorrin-6A/cobalt-precorrin-6A reductase